MHGRMVILTEAIISSENGGFCKVLTGVPVKFETTNTHAEIKEENSVVLYDFTKKSGEMVKDYSFELYDQGR